MIQKARTRSRRHKQNRTPVMIAIVGGVIILLAVLLTISGSSDTAKAADIPLLDGSTVEITNYHGKVLILNFWASWCPPCRAEMPTLEAYYQEYQSNGLELLMINSGEPESTARSFIDESGFAFPVGLDPANQLSDKYQITALPVTLIFDREGELVYRHSGIISWAVLDAKVGSLLQQ